MDRMTQWTNICILSHQILFIITAPAAGALDEDDSKFPAPLRQWMLVSFASGFVLLFLAVYVIINCGDCYNSEVSSENHPATGGGGSVKWGGAEGYSSAAGSSVNDRVLSAGFTGDVVTPGQHLPYPAVGARIPESLGFQGYETGNQYVTDWDAGQQVQQFGQGRQPLPGAHVSVGIDPPPAYSSNYG